MKSYQPTWRVLYRFVLIVAASATTARSDIYDPYGMQYHYKPWGAWGPELTAPNVPRMVNVLQGREPLVPHVAQRVAESKTRRFDALNLLVSMPSGPWTEFDPKATGSQACFLAKRDDRRVVISLAGERVGTDAGVTSHSLLDESQSKMKKLPGAAIEPGERHVSTNGIDGLAYDATVVEGKATTHYSIWVAAHNGYTYKLAVYGEQNDKQLIDETMRTFLRGVKHVQQTRVARGDGKNSRR